ncbi:hypothetical protein [Halospeciosus flavus]|uniref:DUF7979 domain-containing protein n=1 Tax=Halospeciosus flavus TaxID=3032283 RepID=A0ABD5Z8Y4_9EURY|nr:hypothetical protein [Halospeciosus flavus]
MRPGTRVAFALFLLGAAVAAGGAAWTPSATDCESGYHFDVERATPPAGAEVRNYTSLPAPARDAVRAGVRDTPITDREPLSRTYGLGGSFVAFDGETYRVAVLVRDCRYVYPHVLDRVATAGGLLLAVFVGTVWAFWRFAFVPATEASGRRPPE